MTGRPDTHGWEAHLVWDHTTLPLEAERIYLRQRAGDSYNVVTSLTADRPEVQRIDVETLATADGPPGILIPRGVAEAIANIVRPGPSQAELAAYREALDVERARVDAMLTARNSAARTRNSGGVVEGLNVHTGPGPGSR